MHTLRRSGATRFHARNRDLAVLAGQLGHASLTTTQRYVKLELSALRAALEKVEGA
jgi:site-specific recombinase XerD